MDNWNPAGHFETADGDRVGLFELGGHWLIVWAYAAPHGMQAVPYGTDEAEAKRVFTASRNRQPLSRDSREDWQGGSA
ncbi:hypothetical protein ACFO9E_18335 [Streptomyces maoxianensis]|uniref:Uncharacterized protein n=1 Tax=Streptomyces maoxianensis TaxID=1459942 RepID=A0ABV9G9B6_9ACTN